MPLVSVGTQQPISCTLHPQSSLPGTETRPPPFTQARVIKVACAELAEAWWQQPLGMQNMRAAKGLSGEHLPDPAGIGQGAYCIGDSKRWPQQGSSWEHAALRLPYVGYSREGFQSSPHLPSCWSLQPRGLRLAALPSSSCWRLPFAFWWCLQDHHHHPQAQQVFDQV